jgi:hypothetical protein
MSDEARKKLIDLVAGMLLCRKLAALEGRPSPAREMAFQDAIETTNNEENSEILCWHHNSLFAA